MSEIRSAVEVTSLSVMYFSTKKREATSQYSRLAEDRYVSKWVVVGLGGDRWLVSEMETLSCVRSLCMRALEVGTR